MSEETHHEVSNIALSMRIPSFWKDKPRQWFIVFEAATNDLKKGEQQLAQMVITKLEKQDIDQIDDLLSDLHYEPVKKRLIEVYEDSVIRQLQRLLSETELGEQKPTQLLRRMRSLAGKHVPESTLKILWISHLPNQVKSCLAVSELVSTTPALDDLAKAADRMMELNTTQVSSIASSSQGSNENQQIIDEIKKLSLEVAELKTRTQGNQYNRGYEHRGQQRYQSRPPFRSRNASPHRPRAGSPWPHCYYHRRFGANARKCEAPCTYKKSEN